MRLNQDPRRRARLRYSVDIFHSIAFHIYNDAGDSELGSF